MGYRWPIIAASRPYGRGRARSKEPFRPLVLEEIEAEVRNWSRAEVHGRVVILSKCLMVSRLGSFHLAADGRAAFGGQTAATEATRASRNSTGVLLIQWHGEKA